MKLRTFFGLTSRSVLDQVRVELGSDAMIVGSRPTAEGIEVTAVAANAFDAMLREPAAAPTAPGRLQAHDAPRTSEGSTPDALAPGSSVLPPPGVHEDAARAAPPPDAVAPVAAEAEPTGARLLEEFAEMRRLIEEQLAQLTWSESMRRQPLRARFTRDLIVGGYSPKLVRDVTQRVPDDFNAEQATQWLVGQLEGSLRCVPADQDIVTRGGVYALVGPTGVGKTTTTAKLAARCAVRYGAGKVALLSTDTFRVGAQDQLRIYARILGLSVHMVSDRHDLKQALDAVRGRHLVLIDTVGMGQRDARVAEQALLLSQPGVRQLLLLNATGQGETLEEVVRAYGGAPGSEAASRLAGCVVTKIDEAARTGPVLDVVMRHRLALNYVANGQRVPEDLYAPSAQYLVHRSLRASAKPTAFTLEEDELAFAANVGSACHA